MDLTKEELEKEVKRLQDENYRLNFILEKTCHVIEGTRTVYDEKEFKESIDCLSKTPMTIIVIGASGHLARTKTFPALFNLYKQKLLPNSFHIVGYSRSEFSREKFHGTLKNTISGSKENVDGFLSKCFYVSGKYDSIEDFSKLNDFAKEIETHKTANRVFYFAIPPSVFSETASSLKKACQSEKGWNRIIVEKPFGKDLESSNALSAILSQHFNEEQLFRIDHYLGKEMVQNLFILRFANAIFEPLWNRFHVASVQITFKEPFGVEGRGGYFDEFGIIRDVMQNHLMQILCLVAMEPPVSNDAEDIRNEKVKVLKSMEPLTTEDIVIGQYVASEDGKQVGYQDDPSVPDDSVTPTYAQALFKINNARWQGVPFVLKCAKAVNERKAEIRVQFKTPAGKIFKTKSANELVLRVQPSEAIYMKILNKAPGLSEAQEQSELNLTYQRRFQVEKLPDAYERLILDVLRGDRRLFVRNDELKYAWELFTPILHHFENNKIKPLPYVFGTRGPAIADEVLQKKWGIKRYEGYIWKPEHILLKTKSGRIIDSQL